MDRFELFATSIAHIHRCIQKIKANEMASIGLKGTHTMCLYALGKAPEGLSASQLCQKCGEDKAAISRTITELTQLEYICPASVTGKRAYRTKLMLTQKGQEALAFVEQRVENALSGVGGTLDSQARQTLYASLQEISQNLTDYLKKMEERI